MKDANRSHKGAYISWRRMRQRLNHRPEYAHLDVDPRWNDFKVFLADMGERPIGLTLERVDGNSGYWPWNCKWATMKEQSNNRKLRPPRGASGERFIITRGVYYDVELRVADKPLYIKRCKSLEEAIVVRDAAIEEHYNNIKFSPYSRVETVL